MDLWCTLSWENVDLDQEMPLWCPEKAWKAGKPVAFYVLLGWTSWPIVPGGYLLLVADYSKKSDFVVCAFGNCFAGCWFTVIIFLRHTMRVMVSPLNYVLHVRTTHLLKYIKARASYSVPPRTAYHLIKAQKYMR